MTNPFNLTKEQYQELYKEVLLFSQIGGVAADEDNLWKMCLEEHSELMLGIRRGDKQEILDAVCDQFVTFVQLHHYYMSKPTYEQPITSCILANNFDLLDELNERNEAVILPLMSYWLQSATLQAEIRGFNLYKAIKEVNRSNMTKFPTVRELLKRDSCKASVKAWADECEALSNGKYKDVKATIEYYSKTENDFHGEEVVVFRENFGNGKIVKHLAFYQEPNFEDCWV